MYRFGSVLEVTPVFGSNFNLRRCWAHSYRVNTFCKCLHWWIFCRTYCPLSQCLTRASIPSRNSDAFWIHTNQCRTLTPIQVPDYRRLDVWTLLMCVLSLFAWRWSSGVKAFYRGPFSASRGALNVPLALTLVVFWSLMSRLSNCS